MIGTQLTLVTLFAIRSPIKSKRSAKKEALVPRPNTNTYSPDQCNSTALKSLCSLLPFFKSLTLEGVGQRYPITPHELESITMYSHRSSQKLAEDISQSPNNMSVHTISGFLIPLAILTQVRKKTRR